METYIKCPKMFEFYLDQRRGMENADMARGTAAHAVLARLLRLPPDERSSSRAEEIAIAVSTQMLENQFCLHGRLMEHSEGQDSRQEGAEKTQRGVWLSDGIEDPQGAGEKWMHSVLDAVDGYFRLEDPMKADAWFCEHAVQHTLSPTKTALGILDGRIDRLDREVQAEGGKQKTVLVIVDYKASRWGANFEAGMRQLALYAALLAKSPPFNYDEIQGRLLYLNPHEEIPNKVQKSFKQVDLDGALRKASEIRESIIKDEASPAGFLPTPGPFCTRCQFKEKCPAHMTEEEKRVDLVKNSLKNIAASKLEKEEDAMEKLQRRLEIAEKDGKRKRGRPRRVAVDAALAASPVEDGKPGRAESRLAAGDQVHIVRSAKDAKAAAQILMQLSGPECIHAVDFAVAGENRRGRGKVTAFFVYCGPTVTFATGSCLKVSLDPDSSLLKAFASYFENAKIHKVFHDYARAYAHFKDLGITLKGFAGDTDYMGKLCRPMLKDHSLQTLSMELLGNETSADVSEAGPRSSIAIFNLYANLRKSLEDTKLADQLGERSGNMFDLYKEVWHPLAEALADVEQQGLDLDLERIESQTQKFRRRENQTESSFKTWLQEFYTVSGDAALADGISGFRCNSDEMMNHLLFGAKGETKLIDGVRIKPLDSVVCAERKAKRGKATSLDHMVLTELAEGWLRTRNKGHDAHLKHLWVKGSDQLTELRNSRNRAKLREAMQALREHAAAAPSGGLHAAVRLAAPSGRLVGALGPLRLSSAAGAMDQVIESKMLDLVACQKGGIFIIAEYEDLDLRMLAHLAGCVQLAGLLQQEGDPHARIAESMMYATVDVPTNMGQAMPPGLLAKAQALTGLVLEGRGARSHKTIAAEVGVSEMAVKAVLENFFTGAIQAPSSLSRSTSLRGRTMPTSKKSTRKSAKKHLWEEGVADLVAEAVVKLNSSKQLRKLGLKLVLVDGHKFALEGQERRTESSLDLVRDVLLNPFLDDRALGVPLKVRVRAAKSLAQLSV